MVMVSEGPKEWANIWMQDATPGGGAEMVEM